MEDSSLEHLLDLDGEKFVIDERLGLWVKFEVKKIKPSKERPKGIRYSLTLHDAENTRIMGFDNAHLVEYGGKNQVKPKQTYDHWHRDISDRGRPYHYVNASKLLEDFWVQVEKWVKRLSGGNHE